ncbi:hypothetical protein FSPOR_8157 [Fusarium sporotrichioides]|uniref:Uncharacterized protein n=1 Tax=Fusarium sporotrichioides TaxID=5514 RepID=A0A395RWE9_FUSSP|nr:hypothetical protein FSPOR_8157 [Fusarium sporotrichioides]
MWDSTPPRTPLEVTFEDSDSEPGTITPEYDTMSPVVARLEKLAVTHDDENVEDCTTSEYEPSLESNTLVGNDSPPESPIEAVLFRPETPHQSHCTLNPEAKITVYNGEAYNSQEIHAMYLALAEARHNGEFPGTSETTLDARAVVEDFSSLVYLRRVRGDILKPAPPSWIHLREQIALGIQQRSASLRQCESQKEAVRRVNHYLQAVQNEQRYYHTTNAMVQRPNQHGFINVDDDMCSMVEHTIEQGIADATGPLRMNLKHQGEMFQRQTGLVQQQTGLVHQQSRFVEAQDYALQRQHLIARKQEELAKRYAFTTQHHAGILQQQSSLAQQQSNLIQRQDHALQQQYDLLQNQSYSLRKESRFFKKQNDALEKQNQAVREQLDIQHAHIARMQDLLAPQAYNNYATAQNLASANQLISNLSYELPQVIKKAFEDTIEETARLHARQALESAVDIWQQGVRQGMPATESVSSSDMTIDTHDKLEPNTQAWAAAYKKPEKKKATADAEVAERSERSSLYRMVSKFKRRRIARN